MLNYNIIKPNDLQNLVNIIDDTIVFKEFIKRVFVFIIIYILYCFFSIICIYKINSNKYHFSMNLSIFIGFLVFCWKTFLIYYEYEILFNFLSIFLLITFVNFIIGFVNFFCIKIPIFIQAIMNIICLLIGIFNSTQKTNNKIIIYCGFLCFIIQLSFILLAIRKYENFNFIGFGLCIFWN